MTERPPRPVAEDLLGQEIDRPAVPPAERVRTVTDAVEGYLGRLSPAVGAVVEVPDCGPADSAPLAAATAVACRCVQRVVPLAEFHPELGPLVKGAVRTGTEFCLGGRRDGAAAREAWFALADTLGRALDAQPFDLDRVAGAGLAAVAALTLLDAVAASADRRQPSRECGDATRHAGAAVWASSPRAVRLRFAEMAQFADAVRRDVERLDRFDDESALVDPGEAGPFGPLWEGDPPADLRPEAPPASTGSPPELTSTGGSPTLGPMPTVDGPTRPQPDPAPAELAGLSTPAGRPVTAAALAELVSLPDRLRAGSAPQVARFREILAALAGHEFIDRQTASETTDRLQAARILLGLRFIFRSDDPEKDGLRVSLSFDDDPRYKAGVFRTVTTTKPQKKIYNRKTFPVLDVIDSTTDGCDSD